MSYYFYCPKCGCIEWNNGLDHCMWCKTALIETDIKFDFKEWCHNENQITQQIYNQYKIAENPLYDLKAVEKRKEFDKEVEEISYRPPTQQRPKCPTCGSTNVEPISTTRKVGGLFMLGLASKSVGKSYRCKNCNYYW